MKHIKTRILLAIFVLEVLGYSTLVLFNRQASEVALSGIRGQHLDATVEGNLRRINALTDMMESSAKSMASAGEQFLRIQLDNEAYDVIPALEDYLISHFEKLPQAIGGGLWYEPNVFQPDLRRVGPYAFQEGGVIVTTWDLSSERYDYLTQDWYLMGLPEDWDRATPREQDVYWTAPYFDEAATEALMVTVDALMFGPDGSIVGMSTIDWSLAEVTSLVEQISVTPNSEAFLIDLVSRKFLNAQSVGHESSIDTEEWVRELDFDLASGELMRMTTVVVDGTEQRIYYARTNSNMLFGILVPEADFLSEFREISRENTIIGVIISVVFMALVFTLLLLLFRPFVEVLKLVRNSVSKDEATGQLLVTRIEYDKENEFRPLMDAFNEVAFQFDSAYTELRREIRERELAENELRDSQDQLVSAQKMEAIGHLAGGVAHDFNNIITAILGYAEIAKGNCPPKSSIRHDLTEIQRAGERAASLTQQLLLFSRKQAVNLKPIDLNAVINNAFEMFGRVSPDNVYLTIQLEDGLGAVMLDEIQFEQILLNLVVNASDAMPKGGKVSIATRSVALDKPMRTSAGILDPGDYAVVEVEDDGCGMNEEVARSIFEPFFTTKSPGKGTGLGLSTVFGIVARSGGLIWAESTVDVGTKFSVYLPICEEGVVAPEAEERSTPTGGAESVLVVDDDKNVRDVMSRVLKGDGYDVHSSSNGMSALELLDAHPEISILVTDVVMPEMGGPELAKCATERRPDLGVLFVSGYTAGALDGLDEKRELLSKPFTSLELRGRVRQILDRLPQAR